MVEQGFTFEPISHTGWLWPLPPPPDFSTIPPQEAIYLRYRRALDTWLSEDLIPDAVTALLELAERIGSPDVIVTDPFLSAASLAAEKLGVKMAVCGWPANADLDKDKLLPVQQELAADSRGRIERLCNLFGVQGINFAQGTTPSVQSPHLHISYFSEYWYQSEPNFLPQTHFVGGQKNPSSEPIPQWLAAIDGKSAVLITLGSVFTGDLGFFAWSAQAAYHLGWIPIVVIGRTPMSPEDKATLKAALPPQTRLLNWVNYDQVMPRVKLLCIMGEWEQPTPHITPLTPSCRSSCR